MTDFTEPSNGSLRLSNDERDEAVARLNANVRSGRLSDAEFNTRSAAVRSAVTYSDVAPLFSDLPPLNSTAQPLGSTAPPPGSPGQPLGSTAPPPGSPGQPLGSPAPPAPLLDAPNAPTSGRKGPLGGTAGVVAVSIAPLVAIVLFFLTGAFGSYAYSWLWFILIPLTGAIVYAGGTRDRNRN